MELKKKNDNNVEKLKPTPAEISGGNLKPALKFEHVLKIDCRNRKNETAIDLKKKKIINRRLLIENERLFSFGSEASLKISRPHIFTVNPTFSVPAVTIENEFFSLIFNASTVRDVYKKQTNGSRYKT